MNYEQANLTIVASKLTAVGLVAGAAGIMVQILTGVAEYPMIPGTVSLLAAALLVSLLSWRWAPVVGVALAIFILVGAFVTPGPGNRLSEPGEIGPFIGMAVQMLGLITATDEVGRGCARLDLALRS